MASLIPETWGVPEKFKQRIGTSAGRQRAMIDGGHLLLILHGLPQAGDAERTPRLFWRTPAGDWRATGAKGDGLKALKEHLEQYRKRVAELDEQVDTATSAQQLFQIIRHATPIARAARHQHSALQEAREGIDHRDLIVLRDAAGDIERSIELVASDAKNALDYVDAKEAEVQTALARKATDAQHRLNLIAALFLPITAVGSVLGVNLRNGLEGQSPAFYWAVVALALVTGFVVRASVTREEKATP